jgi:predicted nucleic acid-binding protein
VAVDFWDSSALAKRYLPEKGSAWVSNRLDDENASISRLTLVEVASTFRRRSIEAVLDDTQSSELYERFLADSQRFAIVQITEAILGLSTDLLLERRPSSLALRTLDAIQLASALAWFEAARARNIHPGSFVVADQRLLDAAAALELPVLNPEDYA